MTDLFYDLEFLENGRTIELISIGMVCDDGREYYAVNSDMPVDKILNHQWLKANVWPHLPLRGYKPPPQINALQQSDGALDTTDTRVKPKWVIANEVRDFIQATESDVELWANYGAYDHVGLAQLWGPMIALPEGVPMFTNDIQQERARLGIHEDDLPKQESGEHNALADARHNQTVRRWLSTQAWRGAS
ncbi:3'-5' exoribonuclease domain-containing protein [Streptomyces scabiei]|uniref:3'-5' exoribonuclease domain-containing protein n=1 Tax=Streptomyces scabiei TaxID=1930 RepID=UPI001B302388|nr:MULTISPECIES: 3'-5' exoribonuclease [Streptomyces]MBP5870852.1 3'-5' exoribonuclease [Streptomyces sp. LBUM 1485]MBP5913243.1 3'-5' exoribonuclease [Streptomyces sp. LBUM 1486]MDX2532285.1 3'-5' exoribonuclease [Streptomyces scabiei]MDX2794591.1 3'-5' exoribonuclease [Streptomyces scabiei]MDX3822407.1 3'-5' exoribonuclease [Streptomyces scabiei]